MISARSPTEEATVAGEAEVAIDGNPRTTLGWLRWVAGAIATALIAILITAIISWVSRGHSD